MAHNKPQSRNALPVYKAFGSVAPLFAVIINCPENKRRNEFLLKCAKRNSSANSWFVKFNLRLPTNSIANILFRSQRNGITPRITSRDEPQN
jgi:hypothetical protein